VSVRVAGIQTGLQIRKPHDKHGNPNREFIKASIAGIHR